MPETIARSATSDGPRVSVGHVFFRVSAAIRPIVAVATARESLAQEPDDPRGDRKDWALDIARTARQSFAMLRREYEGCSFERGAEEALSEAECRILAIGGLGIAAAHAAVPSENLCEYGDDVVAPIGEYVAALISNAYDAWEWLADRKVWAEVYGH